MFRVFALVLLFAATGTAVLAYGDPVDLARARNAVAQVFAGAGDGRKPQVQSHGFSPRPTTRIAEVQRGNGGEFALKAKINGVATPMLIDTGATWVVLTWETAKAAGLPLEMLDYSVEVETANGKTRAARLTLDRLSVGKLTERSVPALVVPKGTMKTNLLGMSFLDRLESWEVRADRLMLRGYP
jgi:clan AA aspartic protease (TIGR02281 family)